MDRRKIWIGLFLSAALPLFYILNLYCACHLLDEIPEGAISAALGLMFVLPIAGIALALPGVRENSRVAGHAVVMGVGSILVHSLVTVLANLEPLIS